nr:MAG TPA: hypothetical protein [Caudoviricetes sp.]
MSDSRKKYLGIDGLKSALSSFLVGIKAMISAEADERNTADESIKAMISAISEPSLTAEDFDDIFSSEEEAENV